MVRTFHHFDLWDKSCRACSRQVPLRCGHFALREKYRRAFEERSSKTWVYACIDLPFETVKVVTIYAGNCRSCFQDVKGCVHAEHRQRFERMIEGLLAREGLWPELDFQTFIDDRLRDVGLGFHGREALDHIVGLLDLP